MRVEGGLVARGRAGVGMERAERSERELEREVGCEERGQPAVGGTGSVQCEQPEPQPPVCPSASAPSSTWKEWPQPQDAVAFGLLIAKPAAWIEST